jgi:hypothetical protein
MVFDLFIDIDRDAMAWRLYCKNLKIGGIMKTLAKIIGATLIVMFGIHGMYHTVFPAIILDPGSSKVLEKISLDQSARVLPFVNAVMTIDPVQFAATARVSQRCVAPVSLERVTR